MKDVGLQGASRAVLQSLLVLAWLILAIIIAFGAYCEYQLHEHGPDRFGGLHRLPVAAIAVYYALILFIGYRIVGSGKPSAAWRPVALFLLLTVAPMVVIWRYIFGIGLIDTIVRLVTE